MEASWHCCSLWRSCVSQTCCHPERTGLTRARPGTGKLHSLVNSTNLILQTTADISCAFAWKTEDGAADIADIDPQKTDIQCSCWLKIKEQRKKRSKDYRRQVWHSTCLHSAHLHLAGRAFPQQNSPADVLHPASLPSHTLEKQITGTSLSFLTVSSIIPSTHTGKQEGHSLAQRHLLCPLLSGHNKGGSKTRRIFESCFAVCQIIKPKKYHDSLWQNGLFKGLVI